MAAINNITPSSRSVIIMIQLAMLANYISGETANYYPNQAKLMDDLLSGYNKNLPPLLNKSSTIELKFGLAIVHIYGLDVDNQVLSTAGWLRYWWRDDTLRWDPKEYGDIDQIRVPSTDIWVPDIVLYNTAEGSEKRTRFPSQAVLTSDGSILLVEQHNFKSLCNAPKDSNEYHCRFKFASWVWTGFELDIDFYDGLKKIDLNDYNEIYNWKVIGHEGIKNVKYYPCCVEPYPDITYTLTIERTIDSTETYKYLITIFLPTVLLTTLMLMIFCIPADMDSRVNMGMFVFLGYMAVLMILTFLSPEYKDNTYSFNFTHMHWFIIVMICLVTLIIMMSICTTNIARKGEFGLVLPECIRKGFNNCLGCLLCIFYNRQRFLKKYSVSDWDKNEQVVANRDWGTFAAVLDRILFFLSLVCVSATAVVISLYF